ncbi:MAG: Arm DNA-binding domain-containing protein [Steroidobacteraceae bacterium]
MALTEVAVRSAKPSAKDTKLFDERGLYLLICANGSKLWRLKYRFAGREKLLSLGPYPDVGLRQAREHREAANRARRTHSGWLPTCSFVPVNFGGPSGASST